MSFSFDPSPTEGYCNSGCWFMVCCIGGVRAGRNRIKRFKEKPMKRPISPSQIGRFLLGAFLLCILLASQAQANYTISNTLPYRSSYEVWTNGAPFFAGDFLNTNHGWFAEETNALVISTNFANYVGTYEGILPAWIGVGGITNFVGTNHQFVVELNSTATNKFTVATNAPQNISYIKRTYVDMMLKPRRWTLDDPPAVTGEVQMASYFDSNGVVWAWCKTSSVDKVWMITDSGEISTNEWIRFTVTLAYDQGLSTKRAFQMQVNGRALSTTKGQTVPTLGQPGSGGTWLWQTDTLRRYISSITLQGTGHFDDMMVMTNVPFFGIQHSIAVSGTNVVVDNSSLAGTRMVQVVDGNNKTFNVADATGYDVTNVVQDGTSTGTGPGAYIFNNVTTNHTMLIESKPEMRTLVVTTPMGNPTPSGTNVYLYNTTVLAGISGSPIAYGATTQFVCTGWARSVSGTPVGSGSSTSMSFKITGNSVAATTTVAWTWGTQHKLTVYTNQDFTGAGTIVNYASKSWFFTNETVTLEAVTNYGSTFTGWSGADTNYAIVSSNLLMFTNMTSPRIVTANFTGGPPPAPAKTTHGTPISWLRTHYPFDPDPDEIVDLKDTDLDGLFTWEEFIAGTDPTNAVSVFEVRLSGIQDGSNFVMFFGGLTNTIDSLVLPFGIYRATNLLDAMPFTLLTNRIPRSSTGTNWFWQTSPAGARYFYRPVATNSAD